jgi:hypothetical protein
VASIPGNVVDGLGERRDLSARLHRQIPLGLSLKPFKPQAIVTLMAEIARTTQSAVARMEGSKIHAVT